MSDQLGLVTRWFSDEITWASIHIAELAQQLGLRPTILARDICKKEISPYWDQRVVAERKTPFKQWASRCSHIVWTHPPSMAELAWAANRGIQTILLAVWEKLAPMHKEVIAKFDTVVFPYACAGEAVCRACGGTGSAFRARIAPWDVPIPFGTNSRIICDKIDIFVPLYDSQAKRNQRLLFDALESIVETEERARFTIASGTGWSLWAIRRLRQLCKTHPDQFICVERPTAMQRLSLYNTSCLTCWAAHYESLALIGLTSLCMGVPVLAWDIPPQNEYLRHKRNSLLLPCDLESNWLGMPNAVGNYALLIEALLSLLQNPRTLWKMKQATKEGLAVRKQQFQQTWESVLS